MLKKLVDDGNFEAKARGRAVVFKTTVREQIELEAVPEFLASGVENIIRNGIRFTPEGMAVDVSLQRDHNTAVIRIRDYGPGVPEDALTDLFEPFFRVDETRGNENNGTGLGMAIASTAVTQHNGTIVALEVTICLPLGSCL